MKRLFSIFLLVSAFSTQALQATVVDVLCQLEARSAQSKTDSLLIVRNDKAVFQHKSGKDFERLDLQEMTRPILALAFGFLVEERYVTSLDTPVSVFCPEWDKEPWSNFTIRTLLAAEDDYFYCLGSVVKAITGQEWHEYLQNKLFIPLGIQRQCWHVSTEGRVRLHLTAPELAKIGLLIAREGVHKGKQLLSRQWLSCLQKPTTHFDPFLSMQWYLEFFDFSTYWDTSLLNSYACKGISSNLVQNLTQLNGRVVHFGGLAIRGRLVHAWGHDIFCALGGQDGLSSLLQETHCHHLPFGYFNGGGVKSIIAWGKGGQQLIIVPGRNIVAVRQTCHLNNADIFEDFIEVLDSYISEVDCYID